MMRDTQPFFGMETPLRGRPGGRTQALPLRFRLDGLRVERLMSFGWIARGTVNVVWVDCMCGFVCWENGAQEPTPSVLYF